MKPKTACLQLFNHWMRQNKVLSSKVLDLKTSQKDSRSLKQFDDKYIQTEIHDCALPNDSVLDRNRNQSNAPQQLDISIQTETKDNPLSTRTTSKSTSKCILNKVLVLTDGYGKFMYESLRRQMSDSASLRIVCKPGASFREISANSECYINNLSENDFVIMIVHPDNLPVSLHDVTYLANKCFYANLILCIPPIGHLKTAGAGIRGQTERNKDVTRYVVSLKSLNVNIDIADLSKRFRFSDFVKNTCYLKNRGLIKLAKFLKDAIINFASSAKSDCNLVQVSRNSYSDSSDTSRLETTLSKRQSLNPAFLDAARLCQNNL